MSEAGAPVEADETCVTPEMIEAGVDELYASGAIENPLQQADRDLVRRVFSKMLRMAPNAL